MLTLPYTVFAVLFLCGIEIGYLLGRVDLLLSRAVVAGTAAQPTYAPVAGNTLREAMKENRAGKAKIEIDTGKYVGDIRTDMLQKTQQLELGKTTQTQDDISSSVSKLAQLKGK